MSCILFYHEAGSGGDLIRHLLQLTGKYFSRDLHGTVNDVGRVLWWDDENIKVRKTFSVLNLGLKNTDAEWPYTKEQFKEKVDSLVDSHANQTFLWTVSSIHELKKLQKICQYKTVAITYPTELIQFVEKAILYKCLGTSNDGKKLAKKLGNAGIDLFKKGKFTEFIWKYSREGTKPWTLRWKENSAEENVFDHSLADEIIDLADILNGDFSKLKSIFHVEELDQQVIDEWLSKQHQRFIVRPKLNSILEKILGYNPKASPEKELVYDLDVQDKDWINDYFKSKEIYNIPYFSNTQDANNYFHSKNISLDRLYIRRR